MIGAAIAMMGFVVFLWLLAGAGFELPDWLVILAGFCIIFSVPLATLGLAQLAWRWLP